MTNEEFLKDVCPNHTEKSKWNRSELLHILDMYKKQLSIPLVSNRLSKMEEAGKEATSLIAHLKDQHGFNDEEQVSQDKIMEVFEYEGRW